MSTQYEQLLNAAVQLALQLAAPVLHSFANQIETQQHRTLRQLSRDHISQTAQRQALEQIIALYEQQSSTISRRELASILRTAAISSKTIRQQQRIELVVTGPIQQNTPMRRTDQALREVIEHANKSLWIVSFAVYNLSSIRDAVINCAQRGTDIRICVEAPEPSGQRMANDTIRALGKLTNFVRVYIWPNKNRPTRDDGSSGLLHTKCAIADDELLFVSSANLTESAMQLNMEMGVLIRGGEQPITAANYFRNLVNHQILEEVNIE